MEKKKWIFFGVISIFLIVTLFFSVDRIKIFKKKDEIINKGFKILYDDAGCINITDVKIYRTTSDYYAIFTYQTLASENNELGNVLRIVLEKDIMYYEVMNVKGSAYVYIFEDGIVKSVETMYLSIKELKIFNQKYQQ